MRRIAHILTLLFAACASPSATDAARERAAVNAVVDDWHKAAADADEPRYFGHMTNDAVFLGTDATERWNAAAFRAFAHPHFAKGKGWTYVPRSRNVIVGDHGDLAWFDELLDSASYGACRGTGVLRHEGGQWKLAHYSLTVPVPNSLLPSVARMIAEAEKKK